MHSIAHHLCDRSPLRLRSLIIQCTLLNIPPSPLYSLLKVKHFFLAIYNVSVVGGAMYFFSLFASEKPGVSMILRCVGLFISATLPVLIIIFPKFTVIQFKTFFRKNFYMGHHRGSSNESLSNVSKTPVASLFNFRSHSMKVLPDAYTPESKNSSGCNTPSGH
jgi:hypothetical protein